MFNAPTQRSPVSRPASFAWLFALALMIVSLEPSASWADEPPDQPEQTEPSIQQVSVFDQLDAAVGTYVVAPLAAVMMFDVVFWDNELPMRDGERARVGDQVVTRRADGYAAQQRLEVPADQAFPVAMREAVTLGSVEVELVTRFTTPPTLLGKVLDQGVDLASLGLEPASADVDAADAVVSVATLAPFEVQVDRRTGRVVPAEVALDASALPLEVGRSVVVDGVNGTVEALGEAVVVIADDVTLSSTPPMNPENAKLPAVVLWLVLGAIFFTARMQLVNLRAFPHAILVITGKYDHPDDKGEISHFQALSSALSATVGLGNIAGVAIAVSLGGPGAIFWMIVAGFLGMSSKFTECTLGQMYRVTHEDGTVGGGPMFYLDRGLAELGLGPLGKVCAILFAVMCIGGSFGGGNMFQANQSYVALSGTLPFLEGRPATFGVCLAIAVGLVVLGGIKRIGAVAGLLVPFMCIIYVLAGAWILLANAAQVPGAMAEIVREAFSPEAGIGGFVGVLAVGFQRASFSNEAGVGSASIAHAAATTREPVREGIVALLEPFIDTIVVCTMTGLVVVVTETYKVKGLTGVEMTSEAFGSVLPWFPAVLSVAVLLFAFSTMISWSYYGESASIWLFGDWVRLPYRIVFLIFVFIGSVISLNNVVAFSDLMILGMAFPNVLGAVLLSSKVKRALDKYFADLKAGVFEVSN